jgi:hypothetical protein
MPRPDSLPPLLGLAVSTSHGSTSAWHGSWHEMPSTGVTRWLLLTAALLL